MYTHKLTFADGMAPSLEFSSLDAALAYCESTIGEENTYAGGDGKPWKVYDISDAAHPRQYAEIVPLIP